MAISFSGAAKAEICRMLPQKECCAVAQCFGILLFCNSFGAEGIKIITENPREVGADRIVDAVAAYEKYGGPVLVLDFGTAI